MPAYAVGVVWSDHETRRSHMTVGATIAADEKSAIEFVKASQPEWAGAEVMAVCVHLVELGWLYGAVSAVQGEALTAARQQKSDAAA